MPFTHHSHSGQFCDHGANSLEEMVQRAVHLGMGTICLTEHIPRDNEDLYPEEIESSQSRDTLFELFHAYYTEAVRLRSKYAARITILIGFELDWIRPSSRDIIASLFSKYEFDMFVGSIHHVHTFIIDGLDSNYAKAREACGGTQKALVERYFDDQLEMLQTLQPPVIGHFDVIRLRAEDTDPDWHDAQWQSIWTDKILRNLKYVASYGGVLEINSSAFRKGLKEPYPGKEICKTFLAMSGGFALSDDSHSVEQVGTNYTRILPFLDEVGIKKLYKFKPATGHASNGVPVTSSVAVSVDELRQHPMWKSTRLSNI